jgi:hypothetical protein
MFGFGVFEHRRDRAKSAVEVGDRFGEPVARLPEFVGVEDRPDERGEQAVRVAPGVAEAVAEEVHGAALPRAPQHLGDRHLQPGVRVADGQLDADQAARGRGRPQGGRA